MSNAVAVRADPREVVAQVTTMMDSRADQLRSLLGDDERLYERFRTVALHTITSNQRLMESEPASIVEAIRDSATLGLEPNGLMGEGYVLPYRDRKTGRTLAQFQVGYRGLLKLIKRSNAVAMVDAHCVYEHDTFDIELGSEPKVTHKPSLGERGNRIGAYAVARLASGELVIEWMPNADIEMVRRSSKSRDNGPWVDWPDEMARKTVLKRIAKRLPLAHIAERALELEAQADSLAAAPSRPTRQPAQNGAPSAVQRVQERLGITSGRGAAAVGPGAEPVVPEGRDEPPHPATTSGDEALGRVPSPGHDAGGDSRDGSYAGARTASPGTPGSADASTTAEAGTEPAHGDSGVHPPAPESSPSVDPGGTPPASGAAGQMPDAPETANARCDGFSAEHGGRCTRAPAHKGNHVASEGSWKEATK